MTVRFKEHLQCTSSHLFATYTTSVFLSGSMQPAKLHTNKASQIATTTKDFTHKTIFGVDPVKSSYPKSAPCANKGLCDAATATCKCANGHYGESCEKQSTFY